MEFKMDPVRMREMERRMGVTFREDGIFAEMALELRDYAERTAPIDGLRFGMYAGEPDALRERGALVDEGWRRYFTENTAVFCGFSGNQVVSFCILEPADGPLSSDGGPVGGIGCVGTVPDFRKRGIGLRMVDLATLRLKDAGYGVAYIHYTHIAHWYAKLGYRTFARFSFNDPS